MLLKRGKLNRVGDRDRIIARERKRDHGWKIEKILILNRNICQLNKVL
jgi:hypothetical protein